MAQAQFPEPNDLELSADKVVGDGKPVEFGKHSVSNPHPGFGKDPNIGNEFGHTHYPKWVKDVQGKDIIVNNPKEEAELAAPKEAAIAAEKPAKKSGW